VEENEVYRIDVERAKDEPGDIIWENVYVPSCEKNCRYFF